MISRIEQIERRLQQHVYPETIEPEIQFLLGEIGWLWTELHHYKAHSPHFRVSFEACEAEECKRAREQSEVA